MRGITAVSILATIAVAESQWDGMSPAQPAIALSSLQVRGDSGKTCLDQKMLSCDDTHCAPAGWMCCGDGSTVCKAGTRCMVDNDGKPGCCKAGHLCDSGKADITAAPAGAGVPGAGGARPTNSFGDASIGDGGNTVIDINSGVTVSNGVTVHGGSGGGIYVGPDGVTSFTPQTSSSGQSGKAPSPTSSVSGDVTVIVNGDATTTYSNHHSSSTSVVTEGKDDGKDDKNNDSKGDKGKNVAGMVGVDSFALVGGVIAAVAAFL